MISSFVYFRSRRTAMIHSLSFWKARSIRLALTCSVKSNLASCCVIVEPPPADSCPSKAVLIATRGSDRQSMPLWS